MCFGLKMPVLVTNTLIFLLKTPGFGAKNAARKISHGLLKSIQ